MDGFLTLAFIFLIAGVVAVPIAARLGLGSVLGYLIAGIVLSPVLLALGVDVVSLQHFAEFGVVMMLFLVGLELEPRMLWHMKHKLLGLGGLQVGLTTAAVMAVAMMLGQPWSISLAVGLVFALSSTAIVLQSLNEKGLMKSDGGEASFSVLLFQDIAVIPMLALIPLLALPELADIAISGEGQTGHAGADGHGDGGHGNGGHGNGGHGSDDHGSFSLVDGLPGWQRALVTVGAIGAVILVGSTLTRPMFRFIAMAKLRELFTASALLWVIGIALLMTLVGLSPALGTFLAGVVLANSEYRHELESNIDPFKGLLLGLFFITVGAGIDFNLLLDQVGPILAMTAGLIIIKATVLLALSFLFNVGGCDRWLFALGLAQAGEFGFVLLSFTVASHVIPAPLADQLLLVVALSMLLTPGLFILYDKVIAPLFATVQARTADEIDENARIIIAGHGRFGGVINRMLRAAGFNTVVLDHHAESLERIRMFGIKVFFGDAARPDMLHAAGIEEAKLLVVAIDDRHQATEMVRHVASAYPHVHIVARAWDRSHVYELYAAGAQDIIRETFDSATRAGRSALEALGMHPYDAERQTIRYAANDKRSLATLARLYDPSVPIHENTAYVAKAKELIAAQDAEIQGLGGAFSIRDDRGWEPPTEDDVNTVTAENEEAETTRP